ncbi:MAG: cytochrome c peroxidase [Bacteroidota bacterium]
MAHVINNRWLLPTTQVFSKGINNEHTARNSMSIQNLTLTSFLTVDAAAVPDPNGYGSAGGGTETLGGLFWDGRAGQLETMVLMPIQNPREMGTDLNVAKISKLPYYQKLFNDAFGNSYFSQEQIGRALSLFVSSIKFKNTTYDKYLQAVESKQPTDGIMSEQELEGMRLFQGTYNCNNCHQVELVVRTEPRFANIGLNYYKDKGLSVITGNSGDDGKFKVPSLRNVEFTGPYMHDGSLQTLEDVIEHLQ